MADVEGVHLRITGDSSDALKEVQRVINAVSSIKGAHAEISVNSDKAAQEIKNIIAEIEGVKDAHVNVVVNKVLDDKQVIEDTNVEISGNNEGLMQALGESQRAVDNANGQNVTFDIQVQGVDNLDNISSLNPNVNVEIVGDNKPLLQTVEESTNAVGNIPDGTVNIQANDEALHEINALVDELSKNIDAYINLDINSEQFVQNASNITQELTEKLSNPEINIGVHATELTQRIHEVQNILSEIEGKNANVKVSADISQIQQSLNEINGMTANAEIKIDDQALNEAKNLMNEISNNVEAYVNLKINSEQFTQNINGLTQELTEKLTNPEINIGVNSEDILPKIREIQSIAENSSVQLNADNSQLFRVVEEAQNLINGINDKEAQIIVNAELENAKQEIDNLVNEASTRINIGVNIDDITQQLEEKLSSPDINIRVHAEEALQKIHEMQNASINIEANTGSAMADINRVNEAVKNILDAHTQITADGSSAIQELNKIINLSENIPDANVNVNVNDSQALDEINKLVNEASSNFNAVVNLGVNTGEISEKINEIAHALEEKLSHPEINIRAYAGEAIKNISEVLQILQAVESKGVLTKINADGTQAKQEAQEVRDSLNGIQDANVDININAESAKQDINELVNEANKTINAYVNLEINSEEFQQKINSIEQELTKGISNPEVQVNANVEETLKKIHEVQDMFGLLENREVDVNAKVNGGERIEELSNTIKEIPDRSVNFEANLNTDEAQKNLQEFHDKLNEVGDKHSKLTIDGTQSIEESERVTDSIQGIPDRNVNLSLNKQELQEGLDNASKSLEELNGQKATTEINFTSNIPEIEHGLNELANTTKNLPEGNVNLEINTSHAEQELDNFSNEASGQKATIEVNGVADTFQAEEALQNLADDIQAIDEKTAHTKVQADIEGLENVQEASKTLTELQGIEVNTTITISGDTEQTEQAIENLKNTVENLPDGNFGININASQIQEAQNDLNLLNGQAVTTEVQTKSDVPETVNEAVEALTTLQNTETNISLNNSGAIQSINEVVQSAQNVDSTTLVFNGDNTDAVKAANEVQDVASSIENQNVIFTGDSEQLEQAVNEIEGQEHVIHFNIEEEEQSAQVLTDYRNFIDKTNGQTVTSELNIKTNDRDIHEVSQTLSELQGTEANATVTISSNNEIIDETNASLEKLDGRTAMSEVSAIADTDNAEQAIKNLANNVEAVNGQEAAVHFNIDEDEQASQVFTDIQNFMNINGEHVNTEFNITANGLENAKEGLTELQGIQVDSTFTLNGHEITDKTKSALDELDGQTISTKVESDTLQAENDIKEFQEALNALQGKNLTFSADGTQVEEEANRVTENVLNIPDGNVNIEGNNLGAIQAYSEVEQRAQELEQTQGTFIIDGDNRQAIEAANEVQHVTDALEDKNINFSANITDAANSVNELLSTQQSIEDSEFSIYGNIQDAIQGLNEVFATQQSLDDVSFNINGDNENAINPINETQEVLDSLNGQEAGVFVFADTSQAEQNIQNLRQNIEELGNTFAQRLTDDISNISRAFNDVGRQIEGVFGRIFHGIKAGITAIAGTSGILALTATRSLGIGGGFEAQMTSVKVISGATADELEKLTKKAREMGATLPITAAQAAQAMTILAQRGTSVKDILSSVEEITSLTISQGVDTATAAELVGSTMTNFGLAIEDISHVTNAFNIACNSSALSMSKLVSSMKYVAPAASMIGMSLEEALAASEALANAGLPGEMIGSGLAMVITKLATKTKVAGVATRDLDGNMRSLSEVFKELKERGAGLAELNKEFGVRGVKAASGLLKTVDSLDRMRDNLHQVGVTQAAVQEKMKSWPNVWNAFRSATEELHIEIFGQIKEQAKGAVSGVAELTRTFSAWIGETKVAEKALNAFLSGMGFRVPTSNEFKDFLNQFDVQNFVDRIKGFGETARGIGESFVNLFNTIRTPLLFLIEHIDTFGKISFWGWIVGKGLQVPTAIMGFATAFIKLHRILRDLSVLNLSSFMSFLTNPLVFTMAFPTTLLLAGKAMTHMMDEGERKVKETQERVQKEFKENNQNLSFEIGVNFKTGFEKLPDSFYKATTEFQNAAKEEISRLKDTFKNDVAEIWNGITGPEAIVNEITSSLDRLKGTDIASFMGDDYSLKLKELSELEEELKKIKDEVQISLDFGVVDPELDKRLVETQKKISDIQENLKEDIELKFKNDPESFEQIFANLQKTGKDIGDELAEQINQAVSGSAEAYKSLQPDMQKVVDFLKATGYSAKDANVDLQTLIASYKNLEGLKSVQEVVKRKTEVQKFSKDIAKAVQELVEQFPDKIERLQGFLGNQDIELVVNAQLQQAENSLKEFKKTTAESFGISEDIVSQALFERLKELSKQGDKTAQTLMGGFKEAGNEIDRFVKSSRDAVQYMGDTPITFLPELEEMVNQVQKIDPLTNKVTEQYKKAHDALQEWNNFSLDNFLQNARDYVQYMGDTPITFLPELENIVSKIEKIDPVTGRITESFKKAKSALEEWNNFTFDNFIQNAQDAVEYLGASPETFTPVLQKLTSGIQQIDPITGKVTEQFKKAYNALKEWSNVTFDKLANRIQKLRKAFEGGFISEESYQAQYKNLSEQLKVQVVADLEPMKNQFSSLSDYQAVLASEFTSRLEELGGEKMLDMWRSEVSKGGFGDQSGRAIGATIEQSVKYLTQATQSSQNQIPQNAFDFQGFSQVLSPLVQKVETFTTQPQFEYSANFSQVVSELQNISLNVQNVKVAVDSLDGTVRQINVQDFSNLLAPIVNKIDTFNSPVTADTGTPYEQIVNEIRNVSTAIQNMNMAGTAETQMTTDYLSSFSQLVTEIQGVSERINSLENTVKSQQGGNTFDDTNILSSMQEIKTSMSGLEAVLRSLSVGNNFDIDINQEGFVVQQRSDADNIARLTASALRSGLGNGGI